MTFVWEGDTSQALADEVLHSLRQGDHLRHDRQLLRSVVGFLRLLVLPFSQRRALGRPESEMALVIANPVAHGSKFSAVVMKSTGQLSANLVGDRRLADEALLPQMSHFPSLSVPSLKGLVDLRMLMWALKVRWKTPIMITSHPRLSRIYLELLFVVQIIRYRVAADYVQRYSERHLWVSDFDRSAYCRPLMWSARNAGRPTATLVHGSPNGNYLPPVAEHVLVWGETQRAWFSKESPQSTVHVVGRPEMQTEISVDRPKRLRIMHSLEILSVDEQRSLLDVCDSAKEAGMRISLRLHPSAAEADVDESWSRIQARGDLESKDRALLESFLSGDVILGISSTAIVDAVACGVPAWTVADSTRDLPCDLVDLRDASGSLFAHTFGRGDRYRDLEAASSSLSRLRTRLVKATDGESRILIEGALTAVLNSYQSI